MSAYPTLTGLSVTEERAGRDSDFSGSHTVRAPGNNFPLAILTNYNGGEREAYARLFAAAPELLTALRGLFDCEALRDGYRRDDNPEWDAPEIKAARAAIAKATGASS